MKLDLVTYSGRNDGYFSLNGSLEQKEAFVLAWRGKHGKVPGWGPVLAAEIINGEVFATRSNGLWAMRWVATDSGWRPASLPKFRGFWARVWRRI